jgi:hypothetical protein
VLALDPSAVEEPNCPGTGVALAKIHKVNFVRSRLGSWNIWNLGYPRSWMHSYPVRRVPGGISLMRSHPSLNGSSGEATLTEFRHRDTFFHAMRLPWGDWMSPIVEAQPGY